MILWINYLNSKGYSSKMDKYIKICPKCGSTNVTIPSAGLDIALTVPDYCRDCGFRGRFPEVEESKTEEFRKKIKTHNS